MVLTFEQRMIQKMLGWMERKFTLHADIFCEEDVPDYVQQECGIELGGIVAIGLIDPNKWVGENDTERRANLESESWWTDGQAASPVELWVILNTRGTKAPGTPVEEDGYGMNSIERTGDDQEITFEALGVADNRDFWSAVNKRAGWGFVAVSKGSGTARLGTYYSDCSIYADIQIPQSIKERINIAGSAKLSTDMTPGLTFTPPIAVFTP